MTFQSLTLTLILAALAVVSAAPYYPSNGPVVSPQTTIAPQTDFVPITNVQPIVNVLPTDYNNYRSNTLPFTGYGGEFWGGNAWGNTWGNSWAGSPWNSWAGSPWNSWGSSWY
ncbi:hypothetical protein EC991_001170 [Linnemannia zychae]|nr:hypothetical protein EC991_001170 [Linnemannia zychae]